jgi:hypothetical protein
MRPLPLARRGCTVKLPLVFILASIGVLGCRRSELSPAEAYERDLSTATQAVREIEGLPIELRGPTIYALLEREDERTERILREAGAPETWKETDPLYTQHVAALFERCEIFQECPNGMGERLGVKGFPSIDARSSLSGDTL